MQSAKNPTLLSFLCLKRHDADFTSVVKEIVSPLQIHVCFEVCIISKKGKSQKITYLK